MGVYRSVRECMNHLVKHRWGPGAGENGLFFSNNISFSGFPTDGLQLSEVTHQMMGQQAHFSLDGGIQPSKYTRKGH